MAEPLDEKYFKWLYRQVAPVRLNDPKQSYWKLFRILHTKEFIWLIPNDDNRMEDGRDLRYEFMTKKNVEADEDWLDLGCSFLEMLLALCHRLSFEAGGSTRDWFWQLMENLNLHAFNDNHFQLSQQEVYVHSVVDTVIWRSYRKTGRGGLFPLSSVRRHEDQREVELWYQLSSYLLEGRGV